MNFIKHATRVVALVGVCLSVLSFVSKAEEVGQIIGVDNKEVVEFLGRSMQKLNADQNDFLQNQAATSKAMQTGLTDLHTKIDGYHNYWREFSSKELAAARVAEIAAKASEKKAQNDLLQKQQELDATKVELRSVTEDRDRIKEIGAPADKQYGLAIGGLGTGIGIGLTVAVIYLYPQLGKYVQTKAN